MGETEITVEKMGVVRKGGKMETMEREKNKSVKCSKGRYSLNIVQTKTFFLHPIYPIYAYIGTNADNFLWCQAKDE